MNIFVAKLNFKTKTSDLKTLFEQFGEVESAKIIMDKTTNKSKGYGFIEMPDEEEAKAAIRSLDKTDFDGRTIVVQESKEKGR